RMRPAPRASRGSSRRADSGHRHRARSSLFFPIPSLGCAAMARDCDLSAARPIRESRLDRRGTALAQGAARRSPMLSIRSLTKLTLVLALAGCAPDAAAPSQVGSLREAADQGEARFGVPANLTLAIGYVETRWQLPE